MWGVERYFYWTFRLQEAVLGAAYRFEAWKDLSTGPSGFRKQCSGQHIDSRRRKIFLTGPQEAVAGAAGAGVAVAQGRQWLEEPRGLRQWSEQGHAQGIGYATVGRQ